MILISQMYSSVTADEYILGEFSYKYSNTKNRQINNFLQFEGKRNFDEAK